MPLKVPNPRQITELHPLETLHQRNSNPVQVALPPNYLTGITLDLILFKRQSLVHPLSLRLQPLATNPKQGSQLRLWVRHPQPLKLGLLNTLLSLVLRNRKWRNLPITVSAMSTWTRKLSGTKLWRKILISIYLGTINFWTRLKLAARLITGLFLSSMHIVKAYDIWALEWPILNQGKCCLRCHSLSTLTKYRQPKTLWLLILTARYYLNISLLSTVLAPLSTKLTSPITSTRTFWL